MKIINNKNRLILWSILFIISSAYIFLSLQQNIRISVNLLAITAGLVIIPLSFMFYIFKKKDIHVSSWTILLFAFLFRLLFLFQPAQLSDDIYRYLWDGSRSLNGLNPYSASPASIKPADDHSALLLKKINNPELVTIYPPTAQVVFAAGAAASPGITGIKILLIIFDMIMCGIILMILRGMELPAWRAALYAWHPLPVIEIAWSGHIDGVGILFFLFALYLLFVKERQSPECFSGLFLAIKQKTIPLFAGALFAAAVLTKFIVIIYLPVLLLVAASPFTIFLGFLICSILLCIPYIPELQNITGTLGIYLQNWEFSNFAFRTLRDMFSSGDIARIILMILFLICIISIIVFLWIKQRNKSDGRMFTLQSSMGAFYQITLAFLLLSPTLHPWYALYLAALLPFAAGPAGFVLSWAVFLSYNVLIEYTRSGKWIESGSIAAVIWISPFAAYAVSIILKRFFRIWRN
ncbi:MAG: hypothetical protein V1874_10900 [Spirochaetota bacterium]